MILTKRGNKNIINQKFIGVCSTCFAEYSALRKDLSVITDNDKKLDFENEQCEQCGGCVLFKRKHD